MSHRFLSIALMTAFVILLSCSKGKNGSAYLQSASGRPGDMILIMDSLQWKDSLGLAVRKVFEGEVPGLPREEPQFSVNWVQPSKKLGLLLQVRNLVYVFTLDRKTPGARVMAELFSTETLAKIRNDTSFFFSVTEDEYSRGQTVLYLFGDTEAHLIRHLRENGSKIDELLNQKERERLTQTLASVRSTAKLSAFLPQEQHCAIHLPVGFRLADKTDGFVWFRLPDPDIDKNIFIAWKAYTSQAQLQPDSLLKWRNTICRQHLFLDPSIPMSFITTETEVPFNPVTYQEVNFHSNYAVRMRGLWKLNPGAPGLMGGPFTGYAFVDAKLGRLYYIESFLYGPGKSLREVMRLMDASLWTFQTSEELQNTAAAH